MLHTDLSLTDQLVRLIRREGDNFKAATWSFVFENSSNGRTYACSLADAIRHATESDEVRRVGSPVAYDTVYIRVRL